MDFDLSVHVSSRTRHSMFSKHGMSNTQMEPRENVCPFKEEITNIIGEPTWGDTTNVWSYDMGWSSAGFGWKFHTLKITFENERAVKVEQFEAVD